MRRIGAGGEHQRERIRRAPVQHNTPSIPSTSIFQSSLSRRYSPTSPAAVPSPSTTISSLVASQGFLTAATSTVLTLGSPSANLSGMSRIPGIGAPEAMREARAAKERG